MEIFRAFSQKGWPDGQLDVTAMLDCPLLIDFATKLYHGVFKGKFSSSFFLLNDVKWLIFKLLAV